MPRIGGIIAGGRKPALVCLLLAVCIWPALYNGQPVFFSDTPAYIRVADAGVAKILGRQSVWSAPPLSATAGQPTGPKHAKSMSNLAEKSVIAGRSVYYGALLYLGDVFSRLWFNILLQAGAIVLAVSLTLFNAIGFGWLALTVILAGLALATPMAFYASFLMPDIFAGLTILGVGNLLVYGAAISIWQLVIWTGLLGAALSFHASHLLLALAVLAIFVVVAVVSRAGVPWRGATAVVVAAVLAVAGEAAFTLAVAKILGAAPVRPPVLMARMIADGPGARYLKAECPGAGFAMCRFADRPPVVAAGIAADIHCTAYRPEDEALGEIFAAADLDARRALAAQQYAFAVAVFAHDPLAEITAIVHDVATQLGCFGLAEFDYRDGHTFFEDRVPQPYLAAMQRSRAWNGVIPVRLFTTLVLVVAIASTIYVAGALISPRHDRKLARFVEVLLLGVVLNAVICGAISGPYDRYQARVIWLVPFAAMLLYQQRRPEPGI
jgi:hypothetical protein